MEVEILKTKEECDHVQFLITETSGPGKQQLPEIDEIETLSLGIFILSNCINFKFDLFLEPKVSAATFCRIFPFHIMFDRDLKIVQSGSTVARIIPAINSNQCKVTDILDFVS